MSRPRSLRSKIIFGSTVWATALMSVMSIVAYVFVRFHGYPERTHWVLLSAGAIIFFVAGLSMLQRGLWPFEQLRQNLVGVRDGRTQRVAGDYPSELQPLVDDLNLLLEHRDQALRRALTTAGDLAHGLKTPLAVLSQEIDRVKAEGNTELAATLRQQVDRMRRQMDYHLAQARASAAGSTPGTRCEVMTSADGLVRTLRQLHVERRLTIDVRVPHTHFVRSQREDLDEMLGNLLDNACKWARSRVTVDSSVVDGQVVIVVDDDGPGLDPSLREAVLQRGVRADEATSGSGLGLAIVRNLAELYGGTIVLTASPLGGLRAELRLPNA